MSVKKAIERLDELKRVYGNDYVDYSELREILTALDEPEDLASKTINGSSLGWMLDQIRKQEKRLMAVEKAYELERLEGIERRIEELERKNKGVDYIGLMGAKYQNKPSVPEKRRLCPYCQGTGIDAERRDKEFIKIPKDVACRFVELIDDIGGTWKNGGGMRETYDAIKQALKNKGE